MRTLTGEDKVGPEVLPLVDEMSTAEAVMTVVIAVSEGVEVVAGVFTGSEMVPF